MKVEVFHLFFKSDGNGGFLPIDNDLYSLAVKYAESHLSFPVDFTQYKNTWLACEVDRDGKPIRALGVLCMAMVVDFPVCRFSDNAAIVKLVQRVNGHLHDVYGMRGTEALIHHVEDAPPETHCPHYLDWMQLFGLRPADRWLMKVR